MLFAVLRVMCRHSTGPSLSWMIHRSVWGGLKNPWKQNIKKWGKLKSFPNYYFFKIYSIDLHHIVSYINKNEPTISKHVTD